ncbi:MAG: serine/threonine-protein kinase [Bacteroidia bacterium]|nr:serine/threonine protein kinase [Bacteroidia bacterium]MDW8134295.1 serine/threonine-protein kinase [Bacteroidia bacterium]
MSTLLGKKLLNYRIEKLLGQGGMGEVYLGIHTEIGRKVAIKVISPHLAKDPRIQERFKREALILAKLNHPNIVQLYDYWARPEEGLYLIMEYVEGTSLDRYIHRIIQGPMPPHQAIEIFLQVLDAFQYAHENGVIHRDIKPSNILIRNDNVVKILDFGIARIVTPEGSGEDLSLTKTGTTLGTILYMSPEQLRARSPSEIDHRSDIYSLGVVLFEMLTGKEMYDRSQLSEFDILIRIASEPPPSLSELNPRIAPDFEPILSKALAKKREERYENCRSFAADLLKILPNYTSQQGPPSSRNPALTQIQIVSQAPTEAETPTKTQVAPPPTLPKKELSSRIPQKVKYATLILLSIIGLILIGWWLWTNQREKQEALSTARLFVQALDNHEEATLTQILDSNLTPFLAESRISRENALQKYFLNFWKGLEQDSVGWSSELSAEKKDGEWFVEGKVYQLYTTKPQYITYSEPQKYYNRLLGRYDTRYKLVTRTIPSTKICKEKKLRLRIKEKRIRGVELLESRDC